MQDSPSAIQLAEAVREFLKDEILPVAPDARTKFRTLVAMNALGILERELDLEESLLYRERDRLAELLGDKPQSPGSLEELKEQVAEMNRNLAGRIRLGDAPPETLETLKRTVADKLTVVNPRYLERYADQP